jgi:hypothetical protein
LALDIAASLVTPSAFHPLATFLVLVYATTTAFIFVPNVLAEPGLLPG